jgi:RNA polymerase sigma-70 factor (ECF subfamily)
MKDYKDMTELELVLACQQNDQAALTSLLKRYERSIRVLIHRVGADQGDPSDMIQEVNIRIWRSIGSLRNPYAFGGWVKQIVSRLHYDELRKKVSQNNLISMDAPMSGESEQDGTTRDIMDTAPQPEARLLSDELSSKLKEAIASIAEPFRSMAEMRHVDGLSYQEIALRTSTELGTVKSRISRARIKMAKHLAPYMQEAA